MELMQKTMSFFKELKGKLTSADEKEKEEALKVLMQVKELMESKWKSLSEKTGLDPEQLASLAKNMLGVDSQEALKKLAQGMSNEGKIASLAAKSIP
jgi:hypothetical protein